MMRCDARILKHFTYVSTARYNGVEFNPPQMIPPAFRLWCEGKSRCLLTAGTLLVVAACIAGCSRSDDPSALLKSESVTVAIPMGPGPIPSTLLRLAAEKRYFAEQGLDVTLRPMASGAGAIDAVVQQQADLAVAAHMAVILAILDNKPIRLLSRVYRSRDYLAIVARKDRGITRPMDLTGKRIGLISDLVENYFLDLYLGGQGIATGRVTRVFVAMEQIEPALLNGDVDAVAIRYPYNARLIERLGEQAAVFSDPAIYQFRSDLLAGPEFARSRPEVARRFFVALEKALLFLREHPQEAKRLAMAAVEEDPRTLERMWKTSDFTLALDPDLLTLLEGEARWLVARNATRSTAMPNVLGFIDARPLASVQPDAVSILLP